MLCASLGCCFARSLAERYQARRSDGLAVLPCRRSDLAGELGSVEQRLVKQLTRPFVLAAQGEIEELPFFGLVIKLVPLTAL